MNGEVLFGLGWVHEDFGALFVDYGVEGVGLFEFGLFDELFLFLCIFDASLFPLEHFFVEFIIWTCILLWWFLVFEKLFHESFILFLLFLFFLLFILFKFLVSQLQNFLVAILERLMATHLLYKLEWFFIDFGVEFELLLIFVLKFQFFLLNLPFSVFLVLLKSTEQQFVKLVEGSGGEIGLV